MPQNHFNNRMVTTQLIRFPIKNFVLLSSVYSDQWGFIVSVQVMVHCSFSFMQMNGLLCAHNIPIITQLLSMGCCQVHPCLQQIYTLLGMSQGPVPQSNVYGLPQHPNKINQKQQLYTPCRVHPLQLEFTTEQCYLQWDLPIITYVIHGSSLLPNVQCRCVCVWPH